LKKGLFLIVSLVAILTLLLAGCQSETPTTTAPSSPLAAVENRVSAVETRMTAAESAISGISIPTNLSSQVSTLQAQVAALQTDVGQMPSSEDVDIIEAGLASVNAVIEGLSSEVNTAGDNIAGINAELQSIRDEIGGLGDDGLADRLTELETDVSNINGGLVILENTVNAVAVALDVLQDDFTDFETALTALADLEDRIEELEAAGDYWAVMYEEWAARPYVTIVRDNFTSSADEKWVEIRPASTFNRPVILTLYGSALTDVTVEEIERGSYDFLDDVHLDYYDYGTGNTQRVIIMDIVSSGVYWQAGVTYRLVIENSANIDFMEVGVGY